VKALRVREVDMLVFAVGIWVVLGCC
jgi:hypothetical protein